MATVFKSCNRIVARECRDAIAEEADEIAGRASARLAQHRQTGEHEITVTRGKVDAFVNLEGEAPGAVEFGHFDKKTGEWVDGIYVLTREL